MFSAFLDACVLVPSTKADLLLHLAEDEFYRPLWSWGECWMRRRQRSGGSTPLSEWPAPRSGWLT